MDKDKIGNTPLDRCCYLSDKYACNIFIKKEYYNLNKTSKDRPAWHMIKDAVKRGVLQLGDTLVEASSGNTGIGIAQLAQQLGYKCCIFATEGCSSEKLNQLGKHGASVIICNNSNGMSDSESTQYRASQYAKSRPDCFFTDQYNNQQNPLSHFETTGPEIWQQSSERITHFFAGIGTGGTISGVGRFLKYKNPDIRIYGVEPRGSILSYFKKHGSVPADTHVMDKIDGIGRRFAPKVFNPDVVDDIFQVTRQDTMQWAKTYQHEQRDLLGFSSAGVLAGLDYYSQHNAIGRDDYIVLLFADYGDRYMSSLYPTVTKELKSQHD